MTAPEECGDRPLAVRVEVAPGVRLHACLYEPTGVPVAAPPFLLVHGLASNEGLWRGVATRLRAVGHRVVAVDQRSHGRSDQSDELDFVTLASDLVAVADAVGLERPVVVGQSWGGNVVLELARRHPRRISAIVCVDGGTIELSEVFPDWDACWAALAPPRWDQGVRYETLVARASAGEQDGWPGDGRRAQLGNLAVRPDGTATSILPRERHEVIVRQLWDHHPSEVYAQVHVPVLLLPVDTGAPDRTADKRVRVGTARAGLPVSRVHWFVDRHHDVHAQAPDEVTAVLLGAVADGFLIPTGDGGEVRP